MQHDGKMFTPGLSVMCVTPDESSTLVAQDLEEQKMRFTKNQKIRDPKNWPPQVGDLWETEGQDFYVRASTVDGSAIVSAFDAVDVFYPEDVDRFKALNPHLLRRR
jgi:hypothetical protein